MFSKSPIWLSNRSFKISDLNYTQFHAAIAFSPLYYILLNIHSGLRPVWREIGSYSRNCVVGTEFGQPSPEKPSFYTSCTKKIWWYVEKEYWGSSYSGCLQMSFAVAFYLRVYLNNVSLIDKIWSWNSQQNWGPFLYFYFADALETHNFRHACFSSSALR